MRRALLVPPVALAGCLVLGCGDRQSPTAPADPLGLSLGAARTVPVTRPLFGSCTTVVTRLAPPPPIEVQRIEYTCRISHLGLTHAVVTQTVNVFTGALSNSGVYVAANGDELNSSFTGTAQITFTGPTSAAVSFAGTQEFSAGTGRFADANGTAHLVGAAQLDPTTGAAHGEFTLEGTLTY
jgi:hypothetical protein